MPPVFEVVGDIFGNILIVLDGQYSQTQGVLYSAHRYSPLSVRRHAPLPDILIKEFSRKKVQY
jgi:hypothetical protein